MSSSHLEFDADADDYNSSPYFIDYDYDFYGFSDYRGGYNETFYDEYYRSFDGDQYPSYPSYDYPQSGSNATGGGQRPGRQNLVGFKNNI